MKQILLLLCFALCLFSAVAQEKSRIFKDGRLLQQTIEGKDTIAEKPLGDEVFVTYDNYFKSYMVVYKDWVGNNHFLSFEYIKWIDFFEAQYVREVKGTEYYVFGDLNRGKLIFIDNPFLMGTATRFIITGLVEIMPPK